MGNNTISKPRPAKRARHIGQKYWPEILWSEDGLDFVDTGGRLKNYSTGLFCPENFKAGDNLRGVEWGFDVVEENGVRFLERFTCPLMVLQR